MATRIVADDCTKCGACLPECPNHAISEAEDSYVIDPDLCTECVGFYDYEACLAVCPTECCVPDPERVETEGELFERAQRLHRDEQLVLGAATSRFRKRRSG